MVKNLNTVPNVVFDSSNKVFWDTDRNAKNEALNTAPFLKKSDKNWLKTVKNAFFLFKTANFWQFFLNFSRTVLCIGLPFFALRSVSRNA